jgi:hypothetical protein
MCFGSCRVVSYQIAIGATFVNDVVATTDAAGFIGSIARWVF